MRTSIVKLTWFLLLFSTAVFSQIDSTISENQYIYDLLESSSIDIEDSKLIEEIEYLIENKIDINSADVEELMQIPFIDNSVASKIIAFRDNYGFFTFKRAIYNVPDVPNSELEKVLPFVYFSDEKDIDIPITKVDPRNINIILRNRILYDAQIEQGFLNGKYQGTRLASYNRMQIKFDDRIKLYALIEKDVGESSYSDFHSFALSFEKILPFDNLILGNFQFKFGQGLAIWSPYAFSKGSDAINTVDRKSRILRPYSGSNESQFFRGIAFSKELYGVRLAAFYSSNQADVTLSDQNSFSSINISGLHRTENEISRKNNTNVVSSGLALEYYPYKNFKTEFLYFNTKFDKKLETSERYLPDSDFFNWYSVNYSLDLNNIYFSGETSSDGYNTATINNVMLALVKNVSLIFSLRVYPFDYFGLYSNGFGERNGTANETGFYSGVRLNTEYGEFDIYYDLYNFPSSTFSSTLPTSGHDYLINYETRLSSSLSLNARIKIEEKEEELLDGIEKKIGNVEKQNFRVSVDYKINPRFRLRNRVEFVNYSQSFGNNEKGWLILSDIRYNLSGVFRFYFRTVFFETESYNSRVYQFENDLPGVMSNPPLFGKGFRWYFAVSYNPLEIMKISLKYSELFKPNVNSFGSGNSEIPGQLDNRFSFQLDFDL
ncbi:MAG: helix-hairpin-helix domain-containing protein [Melioribacteraceae bacterium]|nr:helix-hairpin-helix domain-containing protein [Melioribacteraceae bacterium]MCF8264997.1 helix-hairpin-helix domain-containing protein [Melioribacteraceae bacterium]MCF8432458.1 helix-hairpin-helix domain-containing protein [Melioribacteraceae bacterium]